MKPTPTSDLYTETHDILLRTLRDEIREGGLPERIEALAGALKTVVDCQSIDFNFRHFLNNQGVLMMGAAQQAMGQQGCGN